MTIDPSGNVGIGTESPLSQLDVSNTGNGAELIRLSTERPWVFRQTGTGSFSQLDLHSTVSSKIFKITSPNDNRAAYFHVTNISEENSVVLVPDGGSVGVGTTTTGPHKLAVEGSIGAREVKVESTTWSDFVFREDYELMPINEVENYIRENKHLPNIPTESQVKDEGINLGEMDAKLLQKIEELTLYVIELKQEIDQLKAENHD